MQKRLLLRTVLSSTVDTNEGLVEWTRPALGGQYFGGKSFLQTIVLQMGSKMSQRI